MHHTTTDTYTHFTFLDIEPRILRERVFVEFSYLDDNITREHFGAFLQALSHNLGMKPHPEQPTPIITSDTGHSLPKHNGYEAMLFWLESGLHAYLWDTYKFLTVDMHSCKRIDGEIVSSTIHEYFNVNELQCNILHATRTDSQ